MGWAPSPAGWYPDPSGRGQHYYDGTDWTKHRTALSDEQRSAILQEVPVQRVGIGCQIVAQSPTAATLIVGQPVNHVAHLLASVFLCGRSSR